MGSTLVKATLVSCQVLAGKSSIVCRLQQDKFTTYGIHIGCNSETVMHKGVQFLLYDVDGDDNVSHPLFRPWVEESDCVIYVVDASNRECIDDEREVLHRWVLSDESAQGKPILIFATKSDVHGCRTIEDIVADLGLKDYADNDSLCWHILAASAKTGEGLKEGLDWLIDVLGVSEKRKRCL